MKSAKFRSEFERVIAAALPPGFAYEPVRIKFTMLATRTYVPDFVDERRKIIVEPKGRFRTFADATKAVAGAHAAQAQGWRVLFVLYDPATRAYPQCRKRADGTALSIGEFLTHHGVRWTSAHGARLGDSIRGITDVINEKAHAKSNTRTKKARR